MESGARGGSSDVCYASDFANDPPCARVYSWCSKHSSGATRGLKDWTSANFGGGLVVQCSVWPLRLYLEYKFQEGKKRIEQNLFHHYCSIQQQYSEFSTCPILADEQIVIATEGLRVNNIEWIPDCSLRNSSQLLPILLIPWKSVTHKTPLYFTTWLTCLSGNTPMLPNAAPNTEEYTAGDWAGYIFKCYTIQIRRAPVL